VGEGAEPVNPATQEVEVRRLTVQSQSRQKVSETLISTNKLDVVACTYNPSYAGGYR
jgi:hypothetical protein